MDFTTLAETPPWEWPPEADRRLFEAVRDSNLDSRQRLTAIELAGNETVVNDEMVEALLALVRDPTEHEGLRWQAAISLGPALEYASEIGFDDPEDQPISEAMFGATREALRALYLDADLPEEVRRAILEASARAPEDWHRGAIRAAHDNDDKHWQLTAVYAMRFVGGFDAEILAALDSDDDTMRYNAICAAGNWEVEAAWPFLEEIVAATEVAKPLLLAAIEAAASIRPEEVADLLAELLDHDHEDIVGAVHEALTMADVYLADELDENLLDDLDDELLD